MRDIPLLYMKVKRIHYSAAAQSSFAMKFSSFSLRRMADQILYLCLYLGCRHRYNSSVKFNTSSLQSMGSMIFLDFFRKNRFSFLGVNLRRVIRYLTRILGTSHVIPICITGTFLSVTGLCKFLNVSNLGCLVPDLTPLTSL